MGEGQIRKTVGYTELPSFFSTAKYVIACTVGPQSIAWVWSIGPLEKILERHLDVLEGHFQFSSKAEVSFWGLRKAPGHDWGTYLLYPVAQVQHSPVGS